MPNLGPNPQYNSTPFAIDRLIAGDENLVTDVVTLITGQNVVRGAVLGQITASGKFNLSLAAAGDGSETPKVIAAQDVDATAADKQLLVYLKGEFDAAELVYGVGHTAATAKGPLSDRSVYLKTSVSA